MQITQIKVNGFHEPIGARLDAPCISFKVIGTESRRAANCRIQIVQESEPDRVLASREGADLNPAGESFALALEPRTAYLVRIFVQGDVGDSAAAETRFETGKMSEPWQAEWISAEKGDGCHPVIRKTLTVRPGLQRARLYAAGVGLFEACVNGEKLGEEYLKPGITNYEKRIQTVTFPVDTLHEGENELSFLLGKGWYMGTFGLENAENNYGDRMAVIAELHLRPSTRRSTGRPSP